MQQRPTSWLHKFQLLNWMRETMLFLAPILLHKIKRFKHTSKNSLCSSQIVAFLEKKCHQKGTVFLQNNNFGISTKRDDFLQKIFIFHLPFLD